MERLRTTMRLLRKIHIPQDSVNLHRRRATAVTLVALMLPLLAGFMALAIDVGYMRLVTAEVQNAADAAALAGASVFNESIGSEDFWAFRKNAGYGITPSERATDVARRNIQTLADMPIEVAVEVGRWDTQTATFVPLVGPSARRANAVRASVTRVDLPLFFAAIFGKHHFSVFIQAVAAVELTDSCKQWSRSKTNIKEGSISDSYDFALGSYNAASRQDEGDVCSCGEVNLSNDSTVYGDVLYGKSGAYHGNSANVHGTVALASRCVDPSIMLGIRTADNNAVPLTKKNKNPWGAFSDWVNDYPDTEWFGDTTDDVNPVNTGLSFDKPNNLDLKIDKDDSLNLPPGNYYLRNLQMKENSKIYVTGPTTIYLEKALDLHDGQIVNVSGDPLDLVIILAGKKLHMKDVSNFSGYIFAPNAKAKLEKGSQVFGSLVAKEMELKGHSQFHADNSLPMGQLSGPPVLVQ